MKLLPKEEFKSVPCSDGKNVIVSFFENEGYREYVKLTLTNSEEIQSEIEEIRKAVDKLITAGLITKHEATNILKRTGNYVSSLIKVGVKT